MKVLEEGKWKTPWSMEALCPEKQCGAKLLIEEGDVKPVDYASQNTFYAECPVCGTGVDIPGVVLPLRIQRMLNKKRKYSSSWD